MTQAPLAIGDRRELFWDDYLIDPEKTTASLKLHHPRAEQVVLVHDQPWEGDGCDYHCIVRDGDLWRMYYLSWETPRPGVKATPFVIAYAQSTDGLHWEKPSLGLCEFNGSTDNNILLNKDVAMFDNFSVFKDTNPDCQPNEVYKGVGVDNQNGKLWCFTSGDGLRFTKAWPMTDQGKFDSLNIALWDRHAQCYRCYIRDFHKSTGEDFAPGEGHVGTGVRDIRWMESTDFKNWTAPRHLDFGDAQDFPLYTNVVQPYYRADHMFIGFPSRYVERKAWTPNFDHLPGVERRKGRMGINPRFGLAVTDCLFMSSRDGRRWHRWDEAFFRPGPQREYNWVYGDCYPAVGMIETPSHLPDADPELSMYLFDNHWGQIPTELRRYTIRIDGFASYHATYKPQCLVTKPFTFTGNELSINFATSAAGSIRFHLRSGETTLSSCELFGDSIDRPVSFEGGDLTELVGKPVTMAIQMSDADVYSFRFQTR